MIAIGLALVGLGFATHELFGARHSMERIVRVDAGDSAETIGIKLEHAGIIQNASAFRLLAKLRGTDRNLKTGTYIFGGHSSLWSAVSRLQQGESQSIKITFPEGLSMHKTFKRIEASGLATYPDLQAAATDTALVRRLTGMQLQSLEGFLYPETYLFPVNSPVDSILSMMTGEFFRKMARAGIEIGQQDDFYNTLILASIVEKEAGNAEERPIIAGVFERRLRLGMALQSCPTVDYILEKRGIRREVLTTHDTQIPSPYNTYQNPGLPPTPISNPQVGSILAALDPVQHNYLYFFADKHGNNVFTTSYEEHQRRQLQLGL